MRRDKPECRHAPSEPIAAFWFTCKHCGQPIESEPCKACNGVGYFEFTGRGTFVCPVCKCTGVSHWVLMDIQT